VTASTNRDANTGNVNGNGADGDNGVDNDIDDNKDDPPIVVVGGHSLIITASITHKGALLPVE
jgi:hypothetical protein